MEQELKLGLDDPEALGDLMAALPKPEAVIAQTNYYFVDDAGRLAQSRTMLRVREERRAEATEAPKVVLTLKRRLEATEGYFIAEERECALESAEWEAVRRGERDLSTLSPEPLRALNIQGPFTCHGIMRNTRHVIHCEGFILEVDRTELPGPRVEAEVEVETHDPEGARALVTRYAKRAGVSLFNQARGKYARFLEALANDPA